MHLGYMTPVHCDTTNCAFRGHLSHTVQMEKGDEAGFGRDGEVLERRESKNRSGNTWKTDEAKTGHMITHLLS